MNKFSVYIIAAVLFSSCASKKVDSTADQTETLLHHAWQLTQLKGEAVPDTVNGKKPYLAFIEEEGRYHASTGCNGINGTYVLGEANGDITFSNGISTRMFCQNMEIENGMTEILGQAKSYEIKDKQLSLTDSTGAVLALFEETTVE